MTHYIIRVSADADITPGRPLQGAVVYPDGGVPIDLPEQANGEYRYGRVAFNAPPFGCRATPRRPGSNWN